MSDLLGELELPQCTCRECGRAAQLRARRAVPEVQHNRRLRWPFSNPKFFLLVPLAVNMAKDRTLRHAVEADTRDSDEFYLESDCDEELVRGPSPPHRAARFRAALTLIIAY